MGRREVKVVRAFRGQQDQPVFRDRKVLRVLLVQLVRRDLKVL